MISFILPFPPSVNAKYRQGGGRRSKGASVLRWEREAASVLNKQNISHITGRVIVEYRLDTPDNRERDAANYEKYTTDFLVARGILAGDSRRYIKKVSTEWTDNIGKVVYVTITPI